MRVRNLILTLLLWLCCYSAAEAKVYMVAAGISDYPGNRDLTLPVSDVTSVLNLYKLNGPVTYRLLVNNEATVNNILNAILNTFNAAGPDDIVIFMFSGHGVKAGLRAYDGTLSYDILRNAMLRSPSRQKIVFADACFSGKMRNGNSSARNNGAGDVMFFLSSRDNETSIENRRMKNGFFTTALIQGLRGKADYNRDRTVTAKELFKYVSAEVKRLSRNRQHPVMWGNFSDTMPVIRW